MNPKQLFYRKKPESNLPMTTVLQKKKIWGRSN